ncbi:MAG: glycosyltransferase family 2 protein [Flavobacteriales bacterium]
MQKLVSIIIPFFNEEARLSRAILSAVNQTYSNIEIILINDGSTDNSQAIAEEIISDFSFVKLYTIPNSGLSVARNLGIEKCNGYYISFLDSDDKFHPNAIDVMVMNIKETKSDLSICKFELKTEQDKIITTGGWKSDKLIISNIIAIDKMYSHQIAYTSWAKLFKSNLAKKVSFPIGLWFEDRPFFLQYLLKANKVSFVDQSLLSIYTSKNSITRKPISEKRILDIQEIWEIEVDIIAKNDFSADLIQLIFRNHLNSLKETMIILTLDKPKNHSTLSDLFYDNIIKTNYQIKSLPIGYKNKLHLNVLRLYKILPRKIIGFILKIKMSRQIEKIKNLRQY